jgi:hypothetical protein
MISNTQYCNQTQLDEGILPTWKACSLHTFSTYGIKGILRSKMGLLRDIIKYYELVIL